MYNVRIMRVSPPSPSRRHPPGAALFRRPGVTSSRPGSHLRTWRLQLPSSLASLSRVSVVPALLNPGARRPLLYRPARLEPPLRRAGK